MLGEALGCSVLGETWSRAPQYLKAPGFLDTTRVAVTFIHAAASSSSGVQITTIHCTADSAGAWLVHLGQETIMLEH